VAAASRRVSFFNYLNHFILHCNRLFAIVSFAMVGRTECNHVIIFTLPESPPVLRAGRACVILDSQF
jgi:hypothetical protein